MATKKEKEAILKLIIHAEEVDEATGEFIDARQELGTWRDGLMDAYELLK